ncbi:alpha/beta hydrolase [Sphingomonas sp. NSE70-1]|uniref:Alpha/beta hydrolase n=1 Tax=Sphingomonas caseinilyticus TaxID=2908205 RepID=A0ABT0RUQ8_9SPHN|nr:alpha/beta hydrolase [Sphingomonas caseinilyticus]MCL6698757.1 alpha/beta hydrolase [Sphingomonas caseinilyticus]
MSAYQERRWTSRDGLTLFARDYPAAGEGGRLPVICLHGLTRNSKDFEEIAPVIAGWGRRVIVADVRGRGQSGWDPNPKNYKPPVYARDVVEMMAALDIERAIFLGTSMGGLITMTLMAVRPRAIAAAVLNDVGPAVSPEGIARILGYAGKKTAINDWNDAANYVRQTQGVAFPDFQDEDWHRFAQRTFRQGPDGPELDYDPAIASPLSKPPSKLAPWIAGFLFRRLARKRPTLLIRGGISDLISSDIADRMQRQAPGMKRVDVPNVGHAPMLTEPAAVDAIDKFLRTVP